MPYDDKVGWSDSVLNPGHAAALLATAGTSVADHNSKNGMSPNFIN